jgi:hypothetical protein
MKTLRGIEIVPRYVERYWDRVQVTPACWLWTRSRSHSGEGYGLMRIGPGNGKMIYVHRLSYVIHYGNFDEDLKVRHKCDNPICSNYMHLELGTQADNMRDAYLRNRMARGESLRQTKLTEAGVAELRQMWRDGASERKIALHFDVARRTIKEALLGQTWRHIPDPVTEEERKIRGNPRRRNL